jgi:hypothetical protein
MPMPMLSCVGLRPWKDHTKRKERKKGKKNLGRMEGANYPDFRRGVERASFKRERGRERERWKERRGKREEKTEKRERERE